MAKLTHLYAHKKTGVLVEAVQWTDANTLEVKRFLAGRNPKLMAPYINKLTFKSLNGERDKTMWRGDWVVKTDSYAVYVERDEHFTGRFKKAGFLLLILYRLTRILNGVRNSQDFY